jgi:hypothetical protein
MASCNQQREYRNMDAKEYAGQYPMQPIYEIQPHPTEKIIFTEPNELIINTC